MLLIVKKLKNARHLKPRNLSDKKSDEPTQYKWHLNINWNKNCNWTPKAVILFTGWFICFKAHTKTR